MVTLLYFVKDEGLGEEYGRGSGTRNRGEPVFEEREVVSIGDRTENTISKRTEKICQNGGHRHRDLL